MKGIYFSRIMPGIETGGGARRRVYQVHETLQTICPLELVSAPRGDRVEPGVLKKIQSNRNKEESSTLTLNPLLRCWSPQYRSNASYLMNISRQWIKNSPDLHQMKLALVDDPIYFPHLIKALKRKQVPVIACCHNLETLSPGQVGPGKRAEAFRREIEILKMCDLALTISREEHLLLRNFNIQSCYFPYFPPEPITQRMMAIRKKRMRRDKKRDSILLLGSVGNYATRMGMLKVIEYWHKENLSKRFGPLLVTGYRTGALQEQIPPEQQQHVRRLGTLTDGELDNLLAEVKAILCYQDGGGGALTRICDNLTAGIPILANTDAARSYYNIKGLVEFPTLELLPDAVGQIDKIETEIPIPPAPDVEPMLSKIKSIIHRR